MDLEYFKYSGCFTHLYCFHYITSPKGRNNAGGKSQQEGEKEYQTMKIYFLFLVTLKNHAMKRIVLDTRTQVVLLLGKDPPTYVLAAHLRIKRDETNSSTLFPEFPLNAIPWFRHLVDYSKLSFLYSTNCVLYLGLIVNCFVWLPFVYFEFPIG